MRADASAERAQAHRRAHEQDPRELPRRPANRPQRTAELAAGDSKAPFGRNGPRFGGVLELDHRTAGDEGSGGGERGRRDGDEGDRDRSDGDETKPARDGDNPGAAASGAEVERGRNTPVVHDGGETTDRSETPTEKELESRDDKTGGAPNGRETGPNGPAAARDYESQR